jgi:hypothetical protein
MFPTQLLVVHAIMYGGIPWHIVVSKLFIGSKRVLKNLLLVYGARVG